MILGVISVAAIIFLLGLVYRLSIHALPFWGALIAGSLALATGAGPIGAGIAAIVSAGVFIGLSDAIYASLRTRLSRVAFAAPFVAAAVFAGYQASRGILGWSVDNPVWLTGLSLLAASATGAMSWFQLAKRASALSDDDHLAERPPSKQSNLLHPPAAPWAQRTRRRRSLRS